MHYHRSVLIKINPLFHSETFHPLLLPFLFDWLKKRLEIAEEVSINYNGLSPCVMQIAKCPWTRLYHPLKVFPAQCFRHVATNSTQLWWFHVRLTCVLGVLLIYSNCYKNCYQAWMMIDYKIFSSCTNPSYALQGL